MVELAGISNSPLPNPIDVYKRQGSWPIAGTACYMTAWEHTAQRPYQRHLDIFGDFLGIEKMANAEVRVLIL